MFRDQFEMTEDEIDGLREVCIFLIKHYLELWFKSAIPSKAPYQDFMFLKSILLDKSIDKDLLPKILKTFSGHLWYLTEESVGLSFFDNSIPSEIMQSMVERLQLERNDDDDSESEGDDEEEVVPQNPHRVTAKVEEIQRSTLNFFQRFQFPTDFLRHPINKWEKLQSYQTDSKIVSEIKVTNDTAERSVQLMSKFIGIITKKDEEFQELVTVCDEYNKSNPTYLKRDLVPH